MPYHDSEKQRSGWKLVLMGVLAIGFGIAALELPATILSIRVLDMIFGVAKPFSASMTAIAALFALVAVVAIDGLVHLFGTGVMGKRASRIRGAVGVAIAVAAIFWPDWTVFAALQLIGIWAIVIGVLELIVARHSSENVKHRALLIIAALASIAIGAGVMTKVLFGAVLVSAFVGIAAAARGITLIMAGVSRRIRHEDERKKEAASAA
jgi:uncharacterized membrane protein HdeD (DUF308 family)